MTCLTLSLMLSVAAPTALAFDFQSAGIYYNIAGNGKSVSVTYADLNNGTYSGHVTIPAQVTYRMTTYPVKAVDNHAFFNCTGLLSVTLPEGITKVGDQAFSHCSGLTSVTFPSTLQRLQDYAFEYCSGLTSVSLPAATSQVGMGAFSYCYALEEIDVDPANPMLHTVDGVLYSRDHTMLMQYPAAKYMETLELEPECTSISLYAFAPALYLDNIRLGASVAGVMDGLFADCLSLRSIEVDPANPLYTSVDGMLLSADGKRLLAYPIGSIHPECRVPDGVETLADMALCGAGLLESLTLPESLRSIGDFALSTLPRLTEVTSLALTPPESPVTAFNPTGTLFDADVYSRATLHVPAEALNAYSRDSDWGRFATIRAIGGSSLQQVAASGATLAVNGLTVTAPAGLTLTVTDAPGRTLCTGATAFTAPAPGLYLVTCGPTTAKLLLH